MVMRIVLERKAEAGLLAFILSPVLAVALTMVCGAALFTLIGTPPLEALRTYFLTPLADLWSLEELTVKAAPLILIAIGLAPCYLSNNWNIGAEGQFVFGAITGSALVLAFHGGEQGPYFIALVLLAGALGGALFALIPAALKAYFGVSEILTSLMLVYIAQYLLDYLVRGPWRDPQGFNFPTSVRFDDWARLPELGQSGRLHAGFFLMLAAVAAIALLLYRTLKGFEIRLVGEAPRAARFAGFNERRLTLFVFMLSGALAGLAGIIEVAGPIGNLQPTLSPGYGFTAIIIAYLGRLNPLGILIAGFFLALTFIGGENAQIGLRVPLDVTMVFQGLLLFFALACDTLILYRVRILPTGEEARGS